MQSDIMLPMIFLMAEIGLLIILAAGWFFGARRLNFNIHHGVVYSVLVAQVIIVGLWMLPRTLLSLPFILANPAANIFLIIHMVFGLITISLGITLAILFLFNRDIPLGLLRKARPFMITTITGWLLAFILGSATFFFFHMIL